MSSTGGLDKPEAKQTPVATKSFTETPLQIIERLFGPEKRAKDSVAIKRYLIKHGWKALADLL